MKFPKFIFVLFFSANALFGVDISVEPQGKYAEIDVQLSNEMIEAITGDYIDLVGWRSSAASTIYEDPGSYNPVALMAAAMFYLEYRDFEKAALLSAGAMVRTQIDSLISKDPTVQGCSTILALDLSEVLEDCGFSEQEQMQWEQAYSNAVETIEEWHYSIPRNYDERWVRLHSLYAFGETDFEEISEEEKQAIIAKYFSTLKGERKISYENISPECAFSFDPKKRKFKHNPSGVSWHLPISINPDVDFYE